MSEDIGFPAPRQLMLAVIGFTLLPAQEHLRQMKVWLLKCWWWLEGEEVVEIAFLVQAVVEVEQVVWCIIHRILSQPVRASRL